MTLPTDESRLVPGGHSACFLHSAVHQEQVVCARTRSRFCLLPCRAFHGDVAAKRVHYLPSAYFPASMRSTTSGGGSFLLMSLVQALKSSFQSRSRFLSFSASILLCFL
jgi:hypothetical protein